MAGTPAYRGKTIEVDERAFTIIGVMPRAFQFPARETMLWLRFVGFATPALASARAFAETVPSLFSSLAAASKRAELAACNLVSCLDTGTSKTPSPSTPAIKISHPILARVAAGRWVGEEQAAVEAQHAGFPWAEVGHGLQAFLGARPADRASDSSLANWRPLPWPVAFRPW